jgi:hypothetical protein
MESEEIMIKTKSTLGNDLITITKEYHTLREDKVYNLLNLLEYLRQVEEMSSSVLIRTERFGLVEHAVTTVRTFIERARGKGIAYAEIEHRSCRDFLFKKCEKEGDL